jgi:pyridoxine kinase
VFALQRLGVEVWPIHTVQFSNHTGYSSWRGRAFDADLIRDLVRGVGERGAFAHCDGVLSGYVGSPEIGEAILDAVGQVKQANSRSLYCCDPVLGDTGGGLYVKPEVAGFVRDRAIAAADMATPNHFELDHITGRTTRSLTDALAAIDALHALGPGVVLVTSVVTDDTPPDRIDVVVSDRSGRYRMRTPRLPMVVNGAGDLLAALFFAQYLRNGSAADAMSCAVAATFGIIERTVALGAQEMTLIEAQNEVVHPRHAFPLEAL